MPNDTIKHELLPAARYYDNKLEEIPEFEAALHDGTTNEVWPEWIDIGGEA